MKPVSNFFPYDTADLLLLFSAVSMTQWWLSKDRVKMLAVGARWKTNREMEAAFLSKWLSGSVASGKTAFFGGQTFLEEKTEVLNTFLPQSSLANISSHTS